MILHVRRCGVARWKARNPLFPAAPVAGVGALRVLQLYAVFTLSPERFCSISVGQYMTRFGGKYAPCAQKVAGGRQTGDVAAPDD